VFSQAILQGLLQQLQAQPPQSRCALRIFEHKRKERPKDAAALDAGNCFFFTFFNLMARDLQDSLCLPWKRQISRRTALLHRQRKMVNMIAGCEM